jgi:hypothetical protein
MRGGVRTSERAQDDIRRLHSLSAGCIGILSRIIRGAATHALKENSSEIRREHLAKAIDEISGLEERFGFNPFRTH